MTCCDAHGALCGKAGGWVPGYVQFCCPQCPQRTRWVAHNHEAKPRGMSA